jgi:hypothetical protein
VTDLKPYLFPEPLPAQRVLQVTDALVADTLDFAFTEDVTGLKTIAKKGTVIARDGAHEYLTPYDNCVVVMPSMRHLKPGGTVMRLAHIRAQ